MVRRIKNPIRISKGRIRINKSSHKKRRNHKRKLSAYRTGGMTKKLFTISSSTLRKLSLGSTLECSHCIVDYRRKFSIGRMYEE